MMFIMLKTITLPLLSPVSFCIVLPLDGSYIQNDVPILCDAVKYRCGDQMAAVTVTSLSFSR